MKLKKVRLNSLSILYILNIKNFGHFLFLFQCLIELFKNDLWVFPNKNDLKTNLKCSPPFRQQQQQQDWQ